MKQHLGRTVFALASLSFLAAPALAQQSQNLDQGPQIDPTDPVGAGGLGMGLGGPPPLCDRIPICAGGPAVANGEAYAGNGQLWQTDFQGGVINLIDTSGDCEVVMSCPVPGGAPSENTYDGDFVYHYNFTTGLIYKIDPNTCEIVASCDAPGDNSAEGLTFDGQFLWKGDSTTLYQFTPPPACEIVFSCPYPADLGGDTADGLTMCGEFLVMLGYSGNLYQINPNTCELVSTCGLNAGPAGNGIASDRVSELFADQPGFIDVVDVDCGVAFEAPQFDDPTPCGQTLNVQAGNQISYDVVASDLDGGDVVTIDATGVPAGASHNPGLPVMGNPASTTFSWTPGAGDAGSHEIVYTATDMQGNATECRVTVEVSAECFLVLGGGPGISSFTPQSHTFSAQVDEVHDYYPVLLNEIPQFALPSLVRAPFLGHSLMHKASGQGTARIAAQVLMWNPWVFPGQPEQWTAGLLVYVRPNGRIWSRSYGDTTGMELTYETVNGADGRRYIRFPFTIPGL